MSKPKTPQAYYVPALDMVIKVEIVSTQQYCAHFPSGPERVRYSEVREGDWKRVGNWEDQTQKEIA
jgi:hypothetical protein